jgi:hypothetical protein
MGCLKNSFVLNCFDESTGLLKIRNGLQKTRRLKEAQWPLTNVIKICYLPYVLA